LNVTPGNRVGRRSNIKAQGLLEDSFSQQGSHLRLVLCAQAFQGRRALAIAQSPVHYHRGNLGVHLFFEVVGLLQCRWCEVILLCQHPKVTPRPVLVPLGLGVTIFTQYSSVLRLQFVSECFNLRLIGVWLSRVWQRIDCVVVRLTQREQAPVLRLREVKAAKLMPQLLGCRRMAEIILD
jgi:hypothetical protein